MGKNDVSKQTVLVLLVLTIAISVIGTWTVLNSAVNNPVIINNDRPDVGQLTFDIASEGEVQVSDSNANIGFEIKKEV